MLRGGHVIEESVMCGGDKRETNISTSTGHNLLTGNTLSMILKFGINAIIT